MKYINDPSIKIPYFTFENIEKAGIAVNGFTARACRIEGCDPDFFQPLLRKDSDPAEVSSCINALTLQFGTDTDHLVTSAQKHTTNIHLVTEKDLGPEKDRPVPEYIDGLITDIPGVMLQTFGADCPTVYLTDPVNKAIGLCHSGRKGTQRRIASVMVDAMSRAFHSSPSDLIAAISPGICTDCYEVGDDVALDFTEDFYGAGTDISVLPFINGKYHIDLFGAISKALTDAGVRSENIEASPLCTRCRKDLFYSYRGEGRITSENSAFLMLTDYRN